jgi:TetR/AcrR family transcriptional repressor of nem operon
MTIVAAEIGAMAVARAVAKSDPSLSNEILKAAHAALLKASKGQ